MVAFYEVKVWNSFQFHSNWNILMKRIFFIDELDVDFKNKKSLKINRFLDLKNRYGAKLEKTLKILKIKWYTIGEGHISQDAKIQNFTSIDPISKVLWYRISDLKTSASYKINQSPYPTPFPRQTLKVWVRGHRTILRRGKFWMVSRNAIEIGIR